MADALFIVMAGDRGRGLAPLTNYWPKPLIRFGPSGRLIDFALYNCLASEAGDVLVLTQQDSKQIELYLKIHWMGPFTAAGRKLMVLPGAKAPAGRYRGTADAVFHGLSLSGRHPEDAVVLAADHVYRMDYRPLLEFHRAHGRAATLAATAFKREDAPRFGIVNPGEGGKVESFHEKPANLEAILPAGGQALASMGAYVFSVAPLLKYLEWNQEEQSHDFGKDVVPRMVEEGQARAFHFTGPDRSSGFWRDQGDLRSYWQLHMDLIDGGLQALVTGIASGLARPPFARLNLVRSYESGSKRIENSMVSNSAFIDAATVENSVVGPGARVENRAVVRRSVLLDGAVVRKGAVLTEALAEPRVEIRPALAELQTAQPPGGRLKEGAGVHLLGRHAEPGMPAALAKEYLGTKKPPSED